MVFHRWLKKSSPKEPKILTIDIENSPLIAYTWGPKWETNLIEIIDEQQILTFSAKWFNGKQITKGLIDYKGYRAGVLDDELIVKEIHALLDEADILVTQNGNRFDIKMINTRFLKHGLRPPSPFKSVDTYSEAKKYLNLPSYKLDDMGALFDIGRKVEHEGFVLWKDCMSGKKEAWNKMKKYNAQDVLLTEKLYVKIRPFMKTHPNLGLFVRDEVCPNCKSDNLQKRGKAPMVSGTFQRYQCMDCGRWSRGTEKIDKFKTLRSVQ